MPKFAANLTCMFTEVPFLERFAAAARAGFRAVEFLFPYAFPAERLAAELRAHDLRLVLFNLPPGNWEAGERGIACLPGRELEFAASVDKAIAYAQVLGTPNVHAMAGIMPASAEKTVFARTYLINIASAAKKCAKHGLKLCIEPINQRSMPGYFLSGQQQACDYIQHIGVSNLVLQFDCFHVQMEEGCVSLKFQELLPFIGHCQIAGVPDRHEPDTGELCYAHLFALMDSLGYSGYVGCEYNPASGTENGLGWFAPWKR